MFKNIVWIISATVLIGIFPASAHAADRQSIEAIAKRITVKFKATNRNNIGSGFIVDKVGDRYKILTACHVIKRSNKQGCIASNIRQDYKIYTHDGQEHSLIAQSLRLPNSTSDTDLATIEFTSARAYLVAQLGNSQQLSIGSTVYAAGFPGNNNSSGYLAPGFNVTKAEQFYFPPAGTVNAHQPQQKGIASYTLSYSILTLKGMSGGPVLNDRGKVIAIHGRGNIASIQSARFTDISTTPIIYSYKTNRNWGIPINTYLTEFLDQPSPVKTPSEAEVFYARGISKLDHEKTEEVSESTIASAVQDFTQAITLRPNYAAAYIARGDAHFLRLLRSSNFSQASYHSAASNLFSERDYLLIAKDYTSAISINPHDAYTYCNRGIAGFLFAQVHSMPVVQCSTNRGRSNCSSEFQTLPKIQRVFTESRQDFEKAIEILPNYAYPYAFKGIALALSAVIAQLPQGQTIQPNDPTLDQSLTVINAAISLDPNQAFMYQYRAMVLYLKGDSIAASKSYQQALALENRQDISEDVSSVNPWTQLQSMLINGEDIENFEIVQPNDRDFNKKLHVLYRVLYLMDIRFKTTIDTEYKKKFIGDAIASAQTPARKSYFQGVHSLMINQDFDKAVQYFNKTIQLDPSYAEAYIAQNMNLIITTKNTSAIPDLQKAASIFREREDTTKYDLVMDIIESLQQRH
jgi:tetratricopeptide (TPR) repeat protein